MLHLMGRLRAHPYPQRLPGLAPKHTEEKTPLREWTGCFLTLLWFVYTLNSHLTQRLDAWALIYGDFMFGDVVYCWISPLLSLHAESLNSYSVSSSKELSAGWGLGRGVCVVFYYFFSSFLCLRAALRHFHESATFAMLALTRTVSPSTYNFNDY